MFRIKTPCLGTPDWCSEICCSIGTYAIYPNRQTGVLHAVPECTISQVPRHWPRTNEWPCQISIASNSHLISVVARNCDVPTHAMQSSRLIVQPFNQDLQMTFRLRSEAIIPLHGCCRRIVQRQVKAPEQVCDCQVELCICETRRERRNQCGKTPPQTVHLTYLTPKQLLDPREKLNILFSISWYFSRLSSQRSGWKTFASLNILSSV
jgi:hypothetical protein